MAKKLLNTFNCPTEFALDVLGGKWKTVILCYLKARPMGYAELRRLLPKLSDKVLSEKLRELTQKDLVTKVRTASKARGGAYTLTPRARSLGTVLHQLYDWGAANARAFGVKVGEPLKEQGFKD